MTKMATIYGKNPLKIFSGTERPVTFKLSMQHCWLGPLIDHDLFYSKVIFGYFGFCMGKRQTVDSSDSIVAYDIKVDLWNQLNEHFKNMVMNGEGHLLTFIPDASDSVFMPQASKKLVGVLLLACQLVGPSVSHTF